MQFMADQNPITAQGTNNGGRIIAPSGNSFINKIGELTNVLGEAAGVYSGFRDAREARAARKAERSQRSAPAMQNTPNVIRDGLRRGGEGDLQQTALYIAGAGALTIGLYIIIKKIM